MVMHHGIQLYPYIHVCHRSIHSLSIPTSLFMSPSQSTLARYFYTYICTYTVVYQTTSVQIVHRLSNDIEISWFFLWFIVLSLNLNTLYLTIRRYDVIKASSLFVTYRPLSHGTLTHRLPLRLTEPTVTQFFTITTDSKLSPHRPVPCSLYPPINGHCTNHRIADPQTKNTDI